MIKMKALINFMPFIYVYIYITVYTGMIGHFV